jgi:hypothetical protein
LTKGAADLNAWKAETLPLLDRRVTNGLETFAFALPEPTASAPLRFWRLRIWVS